MKRLGQFTLVLILFVTSCRVPKEAINTLKNEKKEMLDLPADYYLLLPRLEFDNWDKDYNIYNKFLTRDIMKTQLWISNITNDKKIAFCFNAAKTHVQLDTGTMILNEKQLIGYWRAISNRKTIYIDSAVYAERKLYRDQIVVYDEKEADVLIVFTDKKISIYGNEIGSDKYKKLPSKNYSLQSGRFLLQYGLVKAGGAISFIGIDNEDRLIINWQTVEERQVKGSYITYKATVTQLVLKKM